MLKSFHRVDVLQKYFNMKILQHSICNNVIGFHAEHVRKERQTGVKLGRMYGESNCHGRVYRKVRIPRIYSADLAQRGLKVPCSLSTQRLSRFRKLGLM